MEEKRIEVTVKVGEARVTLEGPEGFVRQEVERLATLGSTNRQATDAQPQIQGEREFIMAKQPKRHHEIVVVLAYCLKQQGHEEFTDEDIRRAYIRAGVRPPKVVSQAIRDAKNKFDYIESGKGRGTYRLSHHGERTVVFDLPRTGTSSS